ncbi:hypothetical protein [Prevotella jejuni]|uniref:hypothetical protein n=1 Tax=Prevotella jejuni TaxID=1177574 RepID=UPI0028F12BDA|nr:hypothetical protein [Prevotella jejuni]
MLGYNTSVTPTRKQITMPHSDKKKPSTTHIETLLTMVGPSLPRLAELIKGSVSALTKPLA